MARRVLLAAAIVAAVAATFMPAARFEFLNWDDGIAVVGNAALALPGAVGWAFTTSLLEHYQPMSWLFWAAIKSVAGVDRQAFHVANIVVHVGCVLLVWLVARRLFSRALPAISSKSLPGSARCPTH